MVRTASSFDSLIGFDICLLLHVASQMWLLGRLIPFMFGDKVTEEDEYWENYLLLLRVVDYLFAPVVSRDETIYLKVNSKSYKNTVYFTIS